MVTLSRSSKDQHQAYPSITKRLLPWTFCAILPLVVFRLYFYPHPILLSSPFLNSSTALSPSNNIVEEEIADGSHDCDFFNGKWIHDKREPLYNGTTCGTIKEEQNCIKHGRPDMDYLYWRWKPEQCKLSRFEPNKFLQLLSDKHLAFVGDSLARNQLESLLCMLATDSAPKLVYKDGEDNKFRRWYFDSRNVNISVYWSPFLVRGVEKSNDGPIHNKVYLDEVSERWAADLNGIDMVVLSTGHWFMLPAVYYEGDDSVLGCHYCPGLNYTEIGFYDVIRRALKTTLKTLIERRGGNGNGIDVILTTFSPAHFEGDWDKFGACPKAKPYEEAEKSLEGMDAEMRKIGIEEVQTAKLNAKQFPKLRLEALDVTKLSLLRPDGHPGPYMYPFPFANGVTERMHNDCVHWCMPGPIDTWNELLLEVIKRWQNQSRKEE